MRKGIPDRRSAAIFGRAAFHLVSRRGAAPQEAFRKFEAANVRLAEGQLRQRGSGKGGCGRDSDGFAKLAAAENSHRSTPFFETGNLSKTFEQRPRKTQERL
jgi:hypothetical protein